MILVNALYDEGGATRAEYEVLLQLLNPFVPHMTEELWQQMATPTPWLTTSAEV